MDTQIENIPVQKPRDGKFDVKFKFDCFEWNDEFEDHFYVPDIDKTRVEKLIYPYLHSDEILTRHYDRVFSVGEEQFIVSFKCNENDINEIMNSVGIKKFAKSERYDDTRIRRVKGLKVSDPYDEKYRLISHVKVVECGQLVEKMMSE